MKAASLTTPKRFPLDPPFADRPVSRTRVNLDYSETISKGGTQKAPTFVTFVNRNDDIEGTRSKERVSKHAREIAGLINEPINPKRSLVVTSGEKSRYQDYLSKTPSPLTIGFSPAECQEDLIHYIRDPLDISDLRLAHSKKHGLTPSQKRQQRLEWNDRGQWQGTHHRHTNRCIDEENYWIPRGITIQTTSKDKSKKELSQKSFTASTKPNPFEKLDRMMNENSHQQSRGKVSTKSATPSKRSIAPFDQQPHPRNTGVPTSLSNTKTNEWQGQLITNTYTKNSATKDDERSQYSSNVRPSQRLTNDRYSNTSPRRAPPIEQYNSSLSNRDAAFQGRPRSPLPASQNPAQDRRPSRSPRGDHSSLSLTSAAHCPHPACSHGRFSNDKYNREWAFAERRE